MKLIEKTVKCPICNAAITNASKDKEITRGRSRVFATSKMEDFLIIVKSRKLLTINTKSSILDVAAALDPSLVTCEACGLIWTECASISLTNIKVKDSDESEKFDLEVNYIVCRMCSTKQKIRSTLESTYCGRELNQHI